MPNSLLKQLTVGSTTFDICDPVARAAAGGSSGYVTPQQYGAVGDGVTDDTAAINACFAAATNVFFPSGTYLVDAHHAGWGHETEGGLRPKSNSVITLAPDAIIKCSTSSTDFYNILHFYNVENVIVQGGKIVGDKATHVQISESTYEFGHGVGVQNSTNIVVRDMEICDCIGDGVILNYGGNSDITLDNLTIHDCRRQGISLTSGDGVVISNCKIYDISGTNPQSGIDIEPDGNKSVTNVVIDGCNIRDTVGASIILANVTNVLDQIHITGCLLDHALFLGGSNVTMNGGKSATVSVKSEKAPMISACSIEEIAVSGGNSAFVGCNFVSSKERFLTVTSDVVSGDPAESIVFSDCCFNINCTHFIFMPANATDRVELLEFKDCHAKITHALTSTYASSGIANFMPTRMVISGSRFEFTAKIYQLFTAKPSSTVALEIIDSDIVNSNDMTNYFISGNATYDCWFENSTIQNYGNMLYGGGEESTGTIILLNDKFPSFVNPLGKISADNVTITNITRQITKYLSGIRSNVQEQIDSIRTYYDVSLNADGTVNTFDSSLNYATVAARIQNPAFSDQLVVTWGNSLFTADANEKLTASNGDIKFIADCEHDGIQRHIIFTLTSANALQTTLIETYARVPVTVWEVADVTQGLIALNANISSSLAWQLTGLNLAPYKRIKIYAKAGRKTGAAAADSSIVPAAIIEMLLDDRAKETVSQNVFIGSAVVQNPNDVNRLGMLTCAVSGDKTKFAVTRATSLYGTAATSNTDCYQYVFKIEGYYD